MRLGSGSLQKWWNVRKNKYSNTDVNIEYLDVHQLDPIHSVVNVCLAIPALLVKLLLLVKERLFSLEKKMKSFYLVNNCLYNSSMCLNGGL